MQSDLAAETIPKLSLKEASSPSFYLALHRALSEYGFVAFYDHGLSADLRTRVFAELARFFELPLGEKMKCHLPGTAGARGYTPFGIEVAKDQTVPDLKEFYHVGREQIRESSHSEPDAQKRAALAALPKNVWPEGLAGFRNSLLELFTVLDDIGGRVLRAVALSLGQKADFFEPVIDVGNSLLRALHYPPVTPESGGGVRAAAHEDINLITLLIGAPQPGLQILNRSGAWIPAPLGEELIICNVGDMLERLSNHVLVSTTHRVVNPEGDLASCSRYSLPFFLHPNSDFVIRTLSSCVDSRRPDRYPEPIVAHNFLEQRLREIGLL